MKTAAITLFVNKIASPVRGMGWMEVITNNRLTTTEKTRQINANFKNTFICIQKYIA